MAAAILEAFFLDCVKLGARWVKYQVSGERFSKRPGNIQKLREAVAYIYSDQLALIADVFNQDLDELRAALLWWLSGQWACSV